MPAIHAGSRVVGAAVLALCGCLTGCNDTPSAPALRDAPVYSSSEEGFRFLVPEGWTQLASTVLPAGPLEGENFLVRYRVKSPEQGASLQVECTQDSESLDLEKHHAGPSYGVDRWKFVEPAEEIDINGATAQRLIYTATSNGQPTTKEVVCFRRNDRVYAFAAVFQTRDEKAREQVRRAVGSVIWE
jgi:hypothetical protein